MDIFIVIVCIIVILLLVAIDAKLAAIDRGADKLLEMATMTDKQKYEYSLKRDDPERYGKYMEAKADGEAWQRSKKETA